MNENDIPSSKDDIDADDIGKRNTDADFSGEPKDHELIFHSLVEQREFSGLDRARVTDLHDDDTEKERSLSVLKSFSRVAHWLVREWRNLLDLALAENISSSLVPDSAGVVADAINVRHSQVFE